MDIYIPYCSENPKTRLSPVLDHRERQTLARRMLEDVIETVRQAGHSPTVLARGAVEIDTPVFVSPKPLSGAVNEVLETHRKPLSEEPDSAIGVVMADLPLVTSDTLDSLCGSSADVTVAPGRRGGTNAVVTRSPAFSVDYHGASFVDHRRIAREKGLSFDTVDSFRLATDIDEPTDLLELYVHGDGRSRAFLDRRFRLANTDNDVSLVRDGDARTDAGSAVPGATDTS